MHLYPEAAMLRCEVTYGLQDTWQCEVSKLISAYFYSECSMWAHYFMFDRWCTFCNGYKVSSSLFQFHLDNHVVTLLPYCAQKNYFWFCFHICSFTCTTHCILTFSRPLQSPWQLIHELLFDVEAESI